MIWRWYLRCLVVCVLVTLTNVATEAPASCQETGSPLDQEIKRELVKPLHTTDSQFSLAKRWSVVREPARHQTGQSVQDSDTVSGTAWEATCGVASTVSGALVYGPYLSFEPGSYAAFFRIKLLDADGDDNVATLDAASNFAKSPLSIRTISTSDLKLNQWVEVPVFFKYAGDTLECRVAWSGNSSIRVDTISLYKINGEIKDNPIDRVPQPTPSGQPRNLTPNEEPRPFQDIFPKSKAPSKELIVLDLRKESQDLQFVAYSLQGLVNRSKPTIYCLSNDEDAEWLKWMQKRGWITSTLLARSTLDLLKRYAGSVVKGMVITDPAMPPTRNIATMIAGVGNGVVASPRIAKLLKLPVIQDLRGKWSTSVQAYRWAFENLWPRLNHHVICCSYPDQMALRDYLVENRIFIFWLSGPNDGARPYANAQKELELMEQLLAKMPVNIPVMSYPYAGKDIGIGEGPGVTLFAEFGKYLVGTTDTSNLSVHSGIPINQLKQKVAPPAPPLDKSKIYVSYIMSDGDNLPVLSVFNFPPLWKDPLRGTFPIGWSASPASIMLMPDIVDYYYSTSTSNDLWLGAVSGIGYTYPDSYALRFKKSERERIFDGFLQQTSQYMNRMDEKILWPMNLTHPDMIARYATQIRGLQALFPDYGRRVSSYQDATYTTALNVPVFCAVTRWQEDATDEEQIAGLVKDVQAMTPTTRPAFMHLFIWNWGAKISVLKEVLNRLGPDYVAVRPDHLAHLYKAEMGNLNVVLRAPQNIVALEDKPLLFTATVQNVSDKPLEVSNLSLTGMNQAKVSVSRRKLLPAEIANIQIEGVAVGDNLNIQAVTNQGKRSAQIKVNRVALDELNLKDKLPTGARLRFINRFPAVTLAHHGGAAGTDPDAINGTTWSFDDSNAVGGYVLFGPYENLPAGKYLALFRVKRTGGGDVLGLVDTCVGGGSPTTSERQLLSSDLPEGKFRSVGTVFNHPGGTVETRVRWSGGAHVSVDSVSIWRVQ